MIPKIANISIQIVAWCCLKKVSYKKTCNVVLKPSKHEEKTFPKEFILGFIPYFVGATFSKKCQMWGFRKKDKKQGWSCSGLFVKKWTFKLAAHHLRSMPVVYSEASQTSKKELFTRIVNSF